MNSACAPGPAEEEDEAAAAAESQQQQQQATRERRPKRATRRGRRDEQPPHHLHGIGTRSQRTHKRKLRRSYLLRTMQRVQNSLPEMETPTSVLVPDSDVEHSDVVDLTSETTTPVEADVVDLTSLDTNEVIDVESDHSMTEARRQSREGVEEDEEILEVLEREFPEDRLLQEEGFAEEVRVREEGQGARRQGEPTQPMLLSSDEEDGEVQVISPAGPSTRSNTLAQATRARRAAKPAAEGATTVSCPVCMDELKQVQKSNRLMCSTVCGHIFCSVCIRDAIQSMAKCPFCRKKLTLKQYHPIYI